MFILMCGMYYVSASFCTTLAQHFALLHRAFAIIRTTLAQQLER
ncbi:hypothetical protein HMPREF1579_01036 [Gardnerella vaginalis JCP8066]|nr:hypothetical protein HMPREF1579_01036 [Gardnerella vaginalis JCP8066]